MTVRKVLITSTSFAKMDPAPVRLLEENNWEITRNKGPFNDEQLADLVKSADAIIVGNDIVGPKTIKAGEKLKVIVEHGTGVDNIDLVSAKNTGIKVINAPNTNSTAVAEFVFASLLSLLRNISAAQNSLKEGNWEGSLFVGSELHGKTLGIIGLGHIGQKTAQIGKGFGMQTIYFDIFRNYDAENQLGVKYVSLDELLSEADVITLHIPLLPETKNFIGSKEFAKMKPMVYIVNVARGGVVNEKDLYQVLIENKIGGVVADVFEVEPVPRNWPLLGFKNAICTPHLAGYTVESLKRTSLLAVQGLVQEFSAIDLIESKAINEDV